jgi:hypothetical protein
MTTASAMSVGGAIVFDLAEFPDGGIDFDGAYFQDGVNFRGA